MARGFERTEAAIQQARRGTIGGAQDQEIQRTIGQAIEQFFGRRLKDLELIKERLEILFGIRGEAGERAVRKKELDGEAEKIRDLQSRVAERSLIFTEVGVLSLTSYQRSYVCNQQNVWVTMAVLPKIASGIRVTHFELEVWGQENSGMQPYRCAGYFLDRSNGSPHSDNFGFSWNTPYSTIHPASATLEFRLSNLGVTNGPQYLQARTTSIYNVIANVAVIKIPRGVEGQSFVWA